MRNAPGFWWALASAALAILAGAWALSQPFLGALSLTVVLIAFYRHHFYGHRLAAARDVARHAMAIGGQALGLPPVWRDVPARPLHGAKDDAFVIRVWQALTGIDLPKGE